MKELFFKKLDDPLGLAVVDLVEYYGQGYIVTRINVPPAHRGKGVARELMREVIEEADKTGTTLFLEIQPSGGLTYEQLRAWYKRLGFVGSLVMIRRPKK